MADDKIPTKPAPLLDLSTFTERPTIIIDGEQYELHNPEEFSVLDYQRIASDGRKLARLIDADELDEEQAVELRTVLDRTTRRLLIAPEEVHAKLGDMHRVAIARAFTSLQRATLRPVVSVPRAAVETVQ